MSEQTQQKRPSTPGGDGAAQDEFVKVDPGTKESNEMVEKLKKAQTLKPPKQPRRPCCCC